jgi:protocatechuate 3,4-dioxygenase, beta subunit
MQIKNRRDFINLSVATGAALLLPGISAAEAALRRTVAQVEGPYYPLNLPRKPSDFRLDQNNDLIWTNGKTSFALGTLLELSGRVLDSNGRPLPNIEVHLWQCDNYGHYHHRDDTHTPKIDKNFQGFGLAVTDGDGRYNFRTIKPVAYPGRTPHIHFKLKNAKYPDLLTTQMYVAGDPANATDEIYQAVSVVNRPTITAALSKPVSLIIGGVPRKLTRGVYDMVLGVTPRLL